MYSIMRLTLITQRPVHLCCRCTRSYLKSVKEKGISETLKIYIGSDYNDIYDLQAKSTPVTDGGENPVTRAYTPSELELDEYGYAEVPVTLVLGDYTKQYTIMVHHRSNDADLSHTTLGLGVTGYEMNPKYNYDTEDYEVTVEQMLNR